jgi:hypothetical protein
MSPGLKLTGLGLALGLQLPWAALGQIGGIGWTPKPVTFNVQWPYNTNESSRYWFTNGIYHCLVYSNDAPFKADSTTLPRTEQRFTPDYTNGEIQYQATLMAPSNENSYCLFQIHTGDAQSDAFGSTTFMLFWFTSDGGSVHDYSGTELANNLGNQWFRLNVDHNLVTGAIRVWVNQKLVWTQQDNGAGDFYMKDGVYEQNHGPTLQMDTYITNILMWVSSGTDPTITTQPADLTNFPGTTAIFTVSALGTAPLNYQWQRSSTNLTDYGHISGSATSTLTLSNVSWADDAGYSVVISNAVGVVTSTVATLTVIMPPLITSQPQSLAVSGGQGAAFSVTAVGTPPLLYQWWFNGAALAGQTAATLTIPSALTTNVGAYSVLVSNSFGVTLSSNARLTLAPAAVGDDAFGQCQNPASATNAIAIAAGAWHSLALRSDGIVVVWGDDSDGQTNVPATLQPALAIAGGGYHSLALQADGSVAAWGANDYGQTNVPAGLDSVLGISAGTWHSVALRREGTVVVWGDNSFGQTNPPAGLTNVTAVAAGGSHTLALTAEGTVVAWGENTDAEGNVAGQSVVPLGLTNVVAIGAGEYHSLAVRADGTVAAWGDDSDGQCDVPVGLSNVVAVAGGGAHSLALQANGTVAAWGDNFNGQCSLPSDLSDVVGIGAGEYHSLALLAGNVPVPQLLRPARQGSRFSALAQTLNRKNYALETNNSVATTDWSALSTNAGNGALLLLTDTTPTNAAAPRRFYRMRQW